MLDKIGLLFSYYYYSHLDRKRYPEALKKWYKSKTGFELDIDNPKTFSEKIQWLKLYDSTPLKAMLTDKYKVRQWVADRIGEEYLVPLLGVWDDARDIDFDLLPNQFALKTNHSSSWNIIVKDKSLLDKRKAVRTLNRWIKTDYAFCCGLQLHYSLIDRKIIAEKYLENGEKGLDDYKFMCFDGKPVYVWTDKGRYGKQHYRNVYDLEWNRLDFDYEYPRSEEADEKPRAYDKMLEIATTLCQGFSHVRVDLYEVGGKIYFGEMTFTSGNGLDRFNPIEWDTKFGEMLHLPIDGLK